MYINARKDPSGDFITVELRSNEAKDLVTAIVVMAEYIDDNVIIKDEHMALNMSTMLDDLTDLAHALKEAT
jgi:hypothetical protein